MGDIMTIRKKELRRKPFFDAVLDGKITLKECQEKLKISYRQVRRSFKRYCAEGDEGLLHKRRGRIPCNAYSKVHQSTVLNLYQEKYVGFGPLLASEKMQKDDNIIVNDETLRLWLKKEGLWTRKRKHVVYRERRERRSQFGDLIQIDGSIHDWFSIGKNDCLLNMVDDATGITLAMLDTGETTQILLTCLKKWIEQYGIPNSVYVDLKSVYVGTKHLKNRDEYSDEIKGFSVFQQVCDALGIAIVRAYSPQAKGRVERKHQVFQDRFLKDLKLYGIKTITEANQYLENEFLSFINLKFSVQPKDAINAHRNAKIYGDLNEIICWKVKRQIRNDWTIRYKNEYFQLREPDDKDIIKPGQFITLKKYLNGEIRFWADNTHIKHGVLSRKPEPPSRKKCHEKNKIKSDAEKLYDRITAVRKHTSPSQNHPWRKYITKKNTVAV